MGSKEEAERAKRQGIILEKEQVKKQKLSEEAPESKSPTEEVSEDKIKEMIQLVPVKDVYVQALQVKHPIIDWKGGFESAMDSSERVSQHQTSINDKEMELWVELKRMYEPDPEDQLWTLTQNYMIRRWRYNLTPVESKFKTPPMLDHQDKYMMKAQVHVSKSSAISDVQPLPRRKHYCQIYQVVTHMLRGRLLASFQDHEHEGGDTRSQGGIKDNDSKIKIQDHSMQMIS
nr:hypothetical protein [Tanacetum cinerariifolium]